VAEIVRGLRKKAALFWLDEFAPSITQLPSRRVTKNYTFFFTSL